MEFFVNYLSVTKGLEGLLCVGSDVGYITAQGSLGPFSK